jgi:CDP-diacylglycerol--serine O-phosphatidyltransferase
MNGYQEREPVRRKRRGVRLLPNLLTSCSLYAGFYSIVSSLNGNFVHAAIAVFISAVFDSLDGKVARLTRTSSRFGVEYDSLSDLVAFGVAPSLLAYLWALNGFGRLGWTACFLFVACGALRLARFNTNVGRRSIRFMQGLSIPTSAMTMSAAVLLFQDLGMEGPLKSWLVLALVIGLSFLMVSNVRYPSFKGELIKAKPFNALVIAVLILALTSIRPQIVIFAVALIYIVWGPLLALYIARRAGEEPAAEDEDEAEAAIF